MAKTESSKLHVIMEMDNLGKQAREGGTAGQAS
jgi:hypothetical protein